MEVAFEITPEEVQHVLSTRFDENVSDEMAESIFDNYIDLNDIDPSVLADNGTDGQIDLVYKEIESQMRNNWDDIDLHLNA